jgi:hypothetical protein
MLRFRLYRMAMFIVTGLGSEGSAWRDADVWLDSAVWID